MELNKKWDYRWTEDEKEEAVVSADLQIGAVKQEITDLLDTLQEAFDWLSKARVLAGLDLDNLPEGIKLEIKQEGSRWHWELIFQKEEWAISNWAESEIEANQAAINELAEWS